MQSHLWKEIHTNIIAHKRLLVYISIYIYNFFNAERRKCVASSHSLQISLHYFSLKYILLSIFSITLFKSMLRCTKLMKWMLPEHCGWCWWPGSTCPPVCWRQRVPVAHHLSKTTQSHDRNPAAHPQSLLYVFLHPYWEKEKKKERINDRWCTDQIECKTYNRRSRLTQTHIKYKTIIVYLTLVCCVSISFNHITACC